LTFDDGLLDAYEHAFPLLERFGMKATFFPIAGAIGRRTDSDVFGPLRHASAEHLREIAARGHEIGSHSLTHADLTFLDREELERELRDSKRILEDILGHAVTSLSFPYGGWNDRVWQVARELGYERATVYRGRARIPEGLLPVLGVYAFDTVDDIMRKAVGDMGPSVATARSRLMPQFARGTPLWRFRSIYRVGRPAGL
jgi:peptidoglycan/xylan/chitin deacetylase (PgdA/CDA1 family)